MPPKQRITRDMILEASFSMFCQEGMEVVNARSVAKALNCSTQPIFSYFSGMDDLKTALEEKARALFEAGINQAIEGDDPLFDGCMSYFDYAMNYPNLFRQLFLLRQEKQPANLAMVNEALREKVVKPLAAKTDRACEYVEEQCVKLWIFTHGLASLAAMGLLDMQKDQVEQLLHEAEEKYGIH